MRYTKPSVRTLEQDGIMAQIVTPVGSTPGGTDDWLNVDFRGRGIQLILEDESVSVFYTHDDYDSPAVELSPEVNDDDDKEPLAIQAFIADVGETFVTLDGFTDEELDALRSARADDIQLDLVAA